VFHTQCEREELLSLVADEFQIEPATSVPEMRRKLTHFLAQHASPRPVLLVIDEAQNLDDSVLECVRLLSDFETPDHKLLHIILAGQPALAEKLTRPSLVQLLQRIVMLVRLKPLSAAETGAYIEHRLRCSGYAGQPLFDERAVSSIHEHSHGVPRRINTLCLNALLLGCSLRRTMISEEIIEEVAADLDISAPDQFSIRTVGGIAGARHTLTTWAPTLPQPQRPSSTPRIPPADHDAAGIPGPHYWTFAKQIARPRYAATLALVLLLVTGPRSLPEMQTRSAKSEPNVSTESGIARQDDKSILPVPHKRSVLEHRTRTSPKKHPPSRNKQNVDSSGTISPGQFVVGNGVKDGTLAISHVLNHE
jgi:hypothetical protein